MQIRHVTTAPTVVGYVSTDEKPSDGYILRGVQFQGTAANLTAQDIKIVNGTGPKYKSTNWQSLAPQIYMRGPTGAYTIHYYYVSDGVLIPGTSPKQYLPGWVNAGGKEVTDTIDLAKGFWILDNYNADATYTLAGQVLGAADNTQTYVDPEGYDLASNPYPVALNPNNATWTGMEGAPKYKSTSWQEKAPQIYVRDANGGYTTHIYFVSDGILIPGTSPKQYLPGWVNAGGKEVTTDVIPAGAGFWFYKGTGDVAGQTVTATYSLTK